MDVTETKELLRNVDESKLIDVQPSSSNEDPFPILRQLEHAHILIIGGTGSLGQHLLTILSRFPTIRLTVISRDENKQWLLKRLFPNVCFELGCLRNKQRLQELLKIHQPTIVIVAGALKHIDQCETNISETIETNVKGAQNVVSICCDLSLAKVISLHTVLFVSTDKACSPVNVYGMSKALAERCFTSVEQQYKHCTKKHLLPKFLCTRYGNVLNSRGSVIPKFIEMGNDKAVKAFPVTDKTMTRFFMTLSESINLIFYALVYGKSGETWIPFVKAVKIYDLANFFAEKYGKTIDVVGKRPGEKIHECLINETELMRTQQRTFAIGCSHEFFVIQSALEPSPQSSHTLKSPYTSEKVESVSTLVPTLQKIIAEVSGL